ncbi:uncharacterized protein [Apostichopus japonicus]
MSRRSTRHGPGPSFDKYMQEDPPGFLVKISPTKGRSLFTSQSFKMGWFLVTYSGELITAKEGEQREIEEPSVFRYFFKYREKKWCVDANTEPQTGPKFGRLVNHGIGGEINSKIVVKTYNSRPVLCLFATKDIKQDTEILYDYGIINLPWVKEVSFESRVREGENAPSEEEQMATCSPASKEPDKRIDVMKTVEDWVRHSDMMSTDEQLAVCEPDSVSEGVIPRSFLTDSEHPMPTCSSTSAELEKTYDVMRSSEDCNGHPNLVLTQEQPAFVEGKSISEEAVPCNSLPEPEHLMDTISSILTELDKTNNVIGSKHDGVGHPDVTLTDPKQRLVEQHSVPEDTQSYHSASELDSDNDDSDDDSEDDDVVPPSDDSNISYVLYPNLTLPEENDSKVVDEQQTNHERTSQITVKSTSNEDCRVYDKRQFCFYCEIPQAKLPRHLRSAHCNESAVADWMQEDHHTLKAAKLTKIRNLGNHLQNCKVLEQGSGELIVRYRPNEITEPSNFIPCPTCYGYYAKRFLYKHTCHLEPASSNKLKRRRGELVRNGKLLLPSLNNSDLQLDELFSKIKGDDVSRCLKSDSLICQLAKKEFLKLGHDKEQQNYIRTKLREMARLLIEIRLISNEPDNELADFIHPAKFDHVVTAARNVAGFDTQTHLYKVPSLALKLGHSIKKCALLVKAQGLKKGDEEIVNQSTNFFELCQMKWTEEVSRHAHRTMTENKRNAPKRLPLTEDICTLSNFLKKIGHDEKRKLDDGKSDPAASWKVLNEVTLTQIMLFNRRRQGEISKVSIDDYNMKASSEKADYISACLSKFERELCKTFTRIEIIGNKGNTVPVLLTKQMEDTVDLLISLRQKVGVNPDNKFLFPCAASNSDAHIRGADCIRKFATLCGAKNPTQLRSTSLRKHVATISQVLNLKDNELDMLAKFMGHDVRVHREFYRLPDATLQVAKISKLLLSLEKGSTASLAGKSLDQIEVDKDDEIDNIESSDDTDDSDEEEEEEEEDTSRDEGSMESVESLHQANGTTFESTNSEGEEPPSMKKGRKYQRRVWTEDEKRVVLKEFRREIALNQLPGKTAIDRVMEKYSCFDGRKWTNIKDFIRNHSGRANKKWY